MTWTGHVESPPWLRVCLCLQAVENPSCNEIRDVLVAAGLNVYAEVRGTGCRCLCRSKISFVINFPFPRAEQQDAPEGVEQRCPVPGASQSAAEADRRQPLPGEVYLP